jgi:glutamyl-tRNA synthetase
MPIRVRFAPSPTGLLHVGALRTVLYDHLFAKKHGGINILRIEDTDRTRYNPDSEAEFVETLRWVGIGFDEGPHVGGPHAPYRQSERKEAGIYAEWIEKLMEKGMAYRAFETPQELEEMREFQQINKQPVGYFGGKWRDALPEETEAALAEGKPFVIRQKIPRNQSIVIQDAIRGRIEWDSNTIDDPVLIKGDGMPTYHFAAMVDDHLMGITHVLRGEEWISSAPKHAALFDAFGWEKPIFVHCPVILGNDSKKLSKRHGATRVLDYAAQGYLPHPLKNFIALIGWSAGEDREVMTEQELIDLFDLDRLQPSPGRFDLEKLRWLNGHYLRELTPAQVLEFIEGHVAFDYARHYHLELTPEADDLIQDDRKAKWAALEALVNAAKSHPEYVLKAIELEQPRVTTLVDFGEACLFFFVDETTTDEKARAKALEQPHVSALMKFLMAASANVPSDFEAAKTYWHDQLHTYQTDHGFEKIGPIVSPTRVAMTGRTSGPGLFELMALLGPERVASRARRWSGV